MCNRASHVWSQIAENHSFFNTDDGLKHVDQ